MSKTNYLEEVLLNHVLRATPYASPAAVYVALFTTAPTETGGGVEVSGGGYTRQSVTFSVPSGGTVSNTADIVFPVATAPWGVITAFAVMDAAAAGNMLYYGNLTATRDVQVNDQIKFPVGQLIVQED